MVNNKDNDKIQATIYINNLDIDQVADIIIERVVDAFKTSEDFVTWFDDELPPKKHNKQNNNVYRMKR